MRTSHDATRTSSVLASTRPPALTPGPERPGRDEGWRRDDVPPGLGARPGRCRKPRPRLGLREAGREGRPRRAARGHGCPAAPRRPGPRPPLRGPHSAPALASRAVRGLPTPSRRHVAFCTVRTSRRFLRLATPLRRRPRHTPQYGAFPLARGERGRRGSRGAGRSPRRPAPPPRACRELWAGPPAACWEMKSFPGTVRSGFLCPPGLPGSVVSCVRIGPDRLVFPSVLLELK